MLIASWNPRNRASYRAFALGFLCAVAGVGIVALAAQPKKPQSFFEVAPPSREGKSLRVRSDQVISIEVATQAIGQSRANRYCVELAEMIRNSDWGQNPVDCFIRVNAPNSVGGEPLRASSSAHYRYQLALRQHESGELTLEVVRPSSSSSPLDFEKQKWVFHSNDALKQREGIQKALSGFFALDAYERPFREFLLAKGVRESRSVALNTGGDYINQATHSTLNFDQAYLQFREESRKNRSWVKAMTEIGVVLGGGAVWYLWDKELNSVDWEYSLDWAGFRRKVTEGIRFDTNELWLNSPGHPMAGALYYGFARSNGMNALEAFLAAFAASAVWELAVEYREVVSVNDMIFTPIAGAAIGEAMHQLKLFFARSKGSWVHDVLLSLFGGASGIDHWLSRNRPPRAASLDEWGFPTDVVNRFDIWAGLTHLAERPAGVSAQNQLRLGFQTELFPLPGYGEAGSHSRLVWDTTLTQLGLDIQLDASKVQVLDFYVRAAWAGYHHQKIEEAQGSGRISGYSFLIAPASGFQHSLRSLGARGTDELAVVNVLGSAMELLVFHGGWKWKVQLHIYGDMAAVHSIAAEDYEDQGGDLSSAKGVLRLRKYYYAFGMTSQLAVQAQRGPIQVGFEFVDQRFDSIEGLDRFQEEVTDDFPLQDERTLLRAYIAASTPVDRLKVVLELERILRESQMDLKEVRPQRARADETRGTVKLLYQF